ncbi:MAG: germination lipoprotein GerS-related protein [Clostridium sp.]|uniref:germination lipoprotein GerS-related protein n=1 Tax=Clostridium sp. TaxID=1506 RepID=UPI00303F911A
MKKIAYALMGILSIGFIVAVILGLKVGTETTDEYNVIERLNEIKAYQSNITIEVINSKETNKYQGVQIYKKDIGYRLDLNDGRSFTFKGDEIQVKDNESTRAYTLDKEFDDVFKYGFIGEYIGLIYTNEELRFETEIINNQKCFIITTLIPGSNNNIYEGSLYYDVDSYVPNKIIIYDNNKRERIIFTYENFNGVDKAEDIELDL